MSTAMEIPAREIDDLYLKLNQEALEGGYFLNPDEEFTKDLVEGLLINEKRYGYQACPCRLASGKKDNDLDIICPCDYRDADINEFSACYCALYVSPEIAEGKMEAEPIPERRPIKEEREKGDAAAAPRTLSSLPVPIWRCKVCGYLCAREDPPQICPVCKAKKERFEKFIG